MSNVTSGILVVFHKPLNACLQMAGNKIFAIHVSLDSASSVKLSSIDLTMHAFWTEGESAWRRPRQTLGEHANTFVMQSAQLSTSLNKKKKKISKF